MLSAGAPPKANTNLISGLDQPQSRFWSKVSCQKSVGLTSGDLVDADDDGVSDDGDESVDVSAHVDLGHVALLEDEVGVAHQWREVTDAVVDRNAAGKRNAWNDEWKITIRGPEGTVFF